MTTVIATVTEKGGSGKTALAQNLCAYWASVGKSVHAWDFDPQQSLYDWHQDRCNVLEEEGLRPMTASSGTQHANYTQALGEKESINAELTLLDAPGSDSVGLRLAMILGDILLVPIKAGGNDFKVARRMVNLLLKASEVQQSYGKPSPKMFMVFNMETSRSTVVREHKRELREQVEGTLITLLEDGIGHYSDFAWANAQGLGVTDFDSTSRASSHIRRLANTLI